MKLSILTGLTVLFSVFSCCTGSELDWDQVDWKKGNTSQTFRNVDNSGVDIQITLSISSGQWSRSNSIDGGGKQPNDNNYYDGNYGHNKGEESLLIYPDFLNNNHNNSYIDVVIRFSKPMNYVSFDLFDVDRGSYWSSIKGWEFEDVIENIHASYNGKSVHSSLVTAGSSITTDNSSDPGDTLYRGNKPTSDSPSSVLGISWKNQPVNQVGFRYSSGSNAGWNPGDQAIGLSDINFSNIKPVPEASTILTGALFAISGIFLGIRKRTKKAA